MCTRLARRNSAAAADAAGPKSNPGAKTTVELLVAAHNEEKVIALTLRSLQTAIERISPDANFEFKITVGLDHCSDKTATVVESFAKTATVSAGILENAGAAGKWYILNKLIKQSSADWVALVDSGSIWEADLLAAALAGMQDGTVMGIAPSYSTSHGGAAEGLNWKLEQFLKQLENSSGGPVSVHGATVLYRRSTLLPALAQLGGTLWLNDDVVIPLTLRMQNPALNIAYMIHPTKPAFVSDCGITAEIGVEYRRRRRMAAGNVQWIRGIFFPGFFTNFAVTLIASRRVARVLWAYWALAIILGSSLALMELLARIDLSLLQRTGIELSLGLCFVGLFIGSNLARRLSMAFLSGLQVPRLWKSMSKESGVSWV
ncbi:MAG: glycosyltransferase [Deltaproteobacteria bacterium]|nr:glycosyltransferase [Deltaproteobacteria bacterium]